MSLKHFTLGFNQLPLEISDVYGRFLLRKCITIELSILVIFLLINLLRAFLEEYHLRKDRWFLYEYGFRACLYNFDSLPKVVIFAEWNLSYLKTTLMRMQMSLNHSLCWVFALNATACLWINIFSRFLTWTLCCGDRHLLPPTAINGDLLIME